MKKTAIILALVFLLSAAYAYGVDLPPSLSVTASPSQNVETTATITAVAVDVGTSTGIESVSIGENGIVNQTKDCFQEQTCALSASFSYPIPQKKIFEVLAKDISGNEVVKHIEVNFTGADYPPVFDQPDDASILEDSQNNQITDLWNYVSDNTPNQNLLFSIVNQTNPALASCVIDSNRYVNCSASANMSGITNITASVDDGHFIKRRTFSVNVLPVNDAPVFNVLPSQAIAEDSAGSSLNLSPFASDIDSQVTFLIMPNNQSQISCSLVNDTFIKFIPAVNFSGLANCDIMATDSELGINQTLSINVTPINDGPALISPLSVSLQEDETANISLAANDIDSTQAQLTWLITPALNLTFSIDNIAKILTITPDAEFSGVRTANLTVSDGALNDSREITIAVSNVNDAPLIANNFTISILEDSPASAYNLRQSANITDIDSLSLTYSLISDDASKVSCSISGDNITIIPALNFNGTSICVFKASDGSDSANGEVTINVANVNDAPSIVNLANITMDEDTNRTINLDVFDSDTPISSILWSAVTSGNSTIAVNNTDKTLKIFPNPDFNGVFTITVTANDSQLADTKSFNVNVLPVADAPLITGDLYFNVSEDSSMSFDIINSGNVINVENHQLNIVIDSSDSNVKCALTNFNLDATNVTITPNSNFNGMTNCSFHVRDGLIASNTANLVINVTPVDDAPIITNLNNLAFPEDTNKSINLSATDVDTPISSIIWASAIDSPNITAVVNNTDKSLRLIPDANFFGSANLTVFADDAFSVVNKTVVIIVSSVNDAPVIGNDHEKTILEDNQLSFDIITGNANITDVENDFLSAIIDSSASNITCSANAKNITITPKPNFYGVSNCTFHVRDSVSNSNAVLLTVNVLSVDDAPIITNLNNIAFPEDTNKSINLTATDVDTPASLITWSSSIDIPNITVTINNVNKSMDIIPDANFFGTANLTVFANDTELKVNKTITIAVLSVNDAPVLLNNHSKSMLEDTILSFDAITGNANITDVENDALSVIIDSSSVNATCSANGKNITITPKANFTGFADCGFHVNDGSLNSNSTFLNIQVLNVNDAPEFNAVQQTIEAGHELNYSLNLFDVENDALSSAVNSTDFSISAGNITFTPVAIGAYDYNITVCDNSTALNSCASKSLIIVVNDNTLPQALNSTIPANMTFGPSNVYEFRTLIMDNDGIKDSILELDNVNYTVNSSGSQNSVADINITGLSGGLHAFKWFVFDNGNNQNVSKTFDFTIAPVILVPSNLTLLLNNSALNITVPQNTTIEFKASTPQNLSLSLKINNVEVASGYSIGVNQTFLDLGQQNISLEFAGNENYTSASKTASITVIDVIPPVIADTTSPQLAVFSPSTTYNLSSSVADNVGVDTVLAEFDGVNYTASNIGGVYMLDTGILGAGTHNYTWFANDTSNNTVASGVYTLNISKASPLLSLTLNGQPNDISLLANKTITVLASSSPSLTLELRDNNTLAQTNTFINFTTSYPSNTTRTYNVSFAGNQNYTSASFARILTVSGTSVVQKLNITPLPVNINVTPALTIAFNTDVPADCRWDSTKLPFNSMANDFSGVNITSHSGNIPNIALGTKEVYVACTDETASSALLLNYSIRNIFDASTISGSNSDLSILNQSAVSDTSEIQNSTIVSSSVINSALTKTSVLSSLINNSILTNCTVTNSTVKNIVSSNCNFANSFVDPPTGANDLTGSTVTGNSNVYNSNVTYSIVHQSDITNSSIYNSTVNQSSLVDVVCSNSIIINSTFSHATCLNADIRNGIINNGTLTFNNSTYNASLNGSTPLTNIVNYAPTIASFIVSSTSINTGDTVTFTAVVSDVNIGGSLNDSVSTLYTFPDNTNSTNLSTSFTFNTAGTFNVIFAVTDSFGESATQTSTITVSTPGSPGGGGGGGSAGGGGGGGGGGARRVVDINLTTMPLPLDVKSNDVYRFKYNDVDYSITVGIANPRTQILHMLLKEPRTSIAITPAEPSQIDLDEDGVMDLQISLTTLSTYGLSKTEWSLISKAQISPVRVPVANAVNTEPTITPEDETPVEITVTQASKWGGKLVALGSKLWGAIKNSVKGAGEHALIGLIIMFGIVIFGAGLYVLFRK